MVVVVVVVVVVVDFYSELACTCTCASDLQWVCHWSCVLVPNEFPWQHSCQHISQTIQSGERLLAHSSINTCSLFLLLTLNTHAQEGYSSRPVCLSVCLSVCPALILEITYTNCWYRYKLSLKKTI